MRFILLFALMDCTAWYERNIETARRRAVVELECRASDIRVIARPELSPLTYDVVGCGHALRYTCGDVHPAGVGGVMALAAMETKCVPELVPSWVSCASSPAMETYRLVPGDIIESDSSDRITAVRHPTNPPTWTRFRPGTATSPPNENVVKGELQSE